MASAEINEDEQSLLLSDKSANDHGSITLVASTTSSLRDAEHFTGRRQKLLVVLCILVTQLCERLTFYGMTANLVLLCRDHLHLPAPWPSTITMVFTGTCFLTPLFGGWLADAYIGRYNAIFGSTLVYTVGTLLMLPVSTSDVEYSKASRLVYFAIALITTALGTGGIKANVSPFGADQVKQDGPRAIQTFFNWFYFFSNLGSLVAFTVIVWVQQVYSLFYGYIITAVTKLLTVIIFTSARNKYLNKPPGGSQLTETANIIYESAVKNRRTPNVPTWLDKAKRSFGGKFTEAQVEDVKAFLRVFPVFLLFIVFWIIYSQTQTTFVIQATFMKLEFPSFTVPAASLFIFVIIAVLVFIPIMDHIVYPLLQRFGIRFTPLRRIGVGLLLATASVVVAGLVEIKRRRVWEHGHFHDQVVFGEHRNASSLNIFWQIPQFMLIGASEVLCAITGLEFAYSQSPKRMKGVVMGCFLITNGLGNYLTSLLVVIVRSASNGVWYPSKNPNEGKLEYFFFLLAGIMMVNFVIFLFVASWYKYKTNEGSKKADAKADLWVDGGTPKDPEGECNSNT